MIIDEVTGSEVKGTRAVHINLVYSIAPEPLKWSQSKLT